MANDRRKKRNTFRKFERTMTQVIVSALAVFLLMLFAAAGGIGWLKWLLGITVMAVCVLSTGLLMLKQEHKRPRSRWMLASFLGLFACTLVSLIVGFPAPPMV